MKKLKLKGQELGELLTRDQMKTVSGGYGCYVNSVCGYYGGSGTVYGLCGITSGGPWYDPYLLCWCSVTPKDADLTSGSGCGSL